MFRSEEESPLRRLSLPAMIGFRIAIRIPEKGRVSIDLDTPAGNFHLSKINP
jgi:hypothetical protein